MNYRSVAPCGLICDLCLGAQRQKNKCVGCNYPGNKPPYCIKCRIKNCDEKNGNDRLLCNKCPKYPCRRLKDLDKRYRRKYGESLVENFKLINEIGIKNFIRQENEKWKCEKCGELLCVHRSKCLHCGAVNNKFPKPNSLIAA
jgi:hypothetical protein